MKFAEELLIQLEAFAAVCPPPRVRAIHLPPGPAEDVGHGEFFALELENGSIGLSYALLDQTLERLSTGNQRHDVVGADPLALVRGYAKQTGIVRTVGFAAANALTRCLYDRAGYSPPKSADSIGELDPDTGDHIGMIGYFKPLVGRIIDRGARLTVVELNEKLVGEHDGYVVTMDRQRLAECNKVVSTSTLLLNDTLDEMLAACRGSRRFAMVGPGAGCLPDALFARGVTFVGGSWIVDGPGFIDALRAGESHSQFTRKCAVTPNTYPGYAALLSAISSSG